MVLTDTHCHLDFDWFDGDRPAVLERAAQAGVGHILIPGITGTSSMDAVVLADSYPMLYAAAGVHPNEARTWNTQTHNALTELSLSHKVIAIGEIGLDYYHERAPRDLQKQVLREQLALASKLRLPVILHMREAKDAAHGDCSEDLLKILGSWVEGLRTEKSPLAERPGVLHSFSGTLETAQAALGLGFYIGLSGPITFENARKRQAVVAELPLERLLIETDAPFLAPHPYRGQRNEPAYVRLIADKIAALQNKTLQAVASATRKNAQRLFNWEK